MIRAKEIDGAGDGQLNARGAAGSKARCEEMDAAGRPGSSSLLSSSAFKASRSAERSWNQLVGSAWLAIHASVRVCTRPGLQVEVQEEEAKGGPAWLRQEEGLRVCFCLQGCV